MYNHRPRWCESRVAGCELLSALHRIARQARPRTQIGKNSLELTIRSSQTGVSTGMSPTKLQRLTFATLWRMDIAHSPRMAKRGHCFYAPSTIHAKAVKPVAISRSGCCGSKNFVQLRTSSMTRVTTMKPTRPTESQDLASALTPRDDEPVLDRQTARSTMYKE